MLLLAAADFSSKTIRCQAWSRSAANVKIAAGGCRFAWCSRWNRLRTNGSPRPSWERGKVRVLFQTPTLLTLVLSPQKGERRERSAQLASTPKPTISDTTVSKNLAFPNSFDARLFGDDNARPCWKTHSTFLSLVSGASCCRSFVLVKASLSSRCWVRRFRTA